jgi:hypothetical protein
MTTEGHFIPLVVPTFNFTMNVTVPPEERYYTCKKHNETEVSDFITFNILPYLEYHGQANRALPFIIP